MSVLDGGGGNPAERIVGSVVESTAKLGKALDPDFLFDIGADAAGVLIPGGSIAVKVARKYIASKKK